MGFRQATGKKLQWLDTAIERGFSNFLFVDQNYGSDPVLRRILSQARKHGYQSLLVEEIGEKDCTLLSEENQALALRRPDFARSVVHRISLFATPKEVQPGPNDFLGYAVFKWDHFAGENQPRARVFECILRPARTEEQNNFIHCARNYEVNTAVGRFSVRGVLYAKQNNLTFVCAHAALRTALACVLPDGDVSYARINALAGVDHKSRLVGETGGKALGLSPPDIERVLDGLGVGYEKLVHEPALKDPTSGKPLILPTEYQRELYGFIESGCPAIVGFELAPQAGASGDPARHAIPVFGHTFNEDAWLPDADRAYFSGGLRYYPSENWLSNFVIHDDNFGPYFCLPRHFLKKDSFRLMYGMKRFPTVLRSSEAEAIGFNFLIGIQNAYPKLNQDWYDRFAVFARQGWLVLRTLLVKRDDYLRFLETVKDRDGSGCEEPIRIRLGDLLPAQFWMVEASAPELYATTRRKFGEILIASDKPSGSPGMAFFLAVRLPGFVLMNSGTGVLDIRQSGLRGHTPLSKTTPVVGP